MAPWSACRPSVAALSTGSGGVGAGGSPALRHPTLAKGSVSCPVLALNLSGLTFRLVRSGLYHASIACRCPGATRMHAELGSQQSGRAVCDQPVYPTDHLFCRPCKGILTGRGCRPPQRPRRRRRCRSPRSLRGPAGRGGFRVPPTLALATPPCPTSHRCRRGNPRITLTRLLHGKEVCYNSRPAACAGSRLVAFPTSPPGQQVTCQRPIM